jgi:hypothetical protein
MRSRGHERVMDSNDFIRRLPSGFKDRDYHWLIREQHILSAFYQTARQFGFDALKLSPVGFADTFAYASNTVGDKAFEFFDKRKRKLMLSPDSNGGLMRWYTSTNTARRPTWTAFVAPAFRYRRMSGSATRHFTQIGFAVVNPFKSAELVGEHSLWSAEALAQLFDGLGIMFTAYVSDLGAIWAAAQNAGLRTEDCSGFFWNLAKVPISERSAWIQAKLGAAGECLESLVSRGPRNIQSVSEYGAEHRVCVEAARALSSACAGDVYLNASDIAGAELCRGVRVSFRNPAGHQIGEAVDYSAYATDFCGEETRFYSAATGVESIINYTEVGQMQLVHTNDRLLLLNLDASAHFVRQTLLKLREAGYGVICQQVSGKLSNILARAKAEFEVYSVIGAREECAGRVTVSRRGDKIEVDI